MVNNGHQESLYLTITGHQDGHQELGGLSSTSAVAAATAAPRAPADNQWAHFWMAIGRPEFGGLGTVPRLTSNRTALGRPVVTVREASSGWFLSTGQTRRKDGGLQLGKTNLQDLNPQPSP
ncbi:hypothetical protein PCANC_17069 [Puccinia coronata f. sp. avenae]|uniref:Uncharacterized protein n=1 Tax=Puccinia coronata f. sp. avenae TaxID=200324 RepID=A0A2N5SLE8_9BASI|nr:hypothetical protein PCANC_17069 [Puccinia coronata f. sp. avenae]